MTNFTNANPSPFWNIAAIKSVVIEAFSGIAAQAVVIPKTVTAITGNPFADSAVSTVYGYPGTAAQTYANTYGKTFVPLSDAYLAKLQTII